MRLLIINGPNLNLLGTRNPEMYGSKTFEDYLGYLKSKFPKVEFSYKQSNVEGEIINFLHQAREKHQGILLNAGGYTHTSVAIADTIEAINVPVVEIHISNIFKRENYRQISFIANKCKGSISGFGLDSYRLGVLSFLQEKKVICQN